MSFAQAKAPFNAAYNRFKGQASLPWGATLVEVGVMAAGSRNETSLRKRLYCVLSNAGSVTRNAMDEEEI